MQELLENVHDVLRVVARDLGREVCDAVESGRRRRVALFARRGSVGGVPVIGAGKRFVLKLAATDDAALALVDPLLATATVAHRGRRGGLGTVPLVEAVHPRVRRGPLAINVVILCQGWLWEEIAQVPLADVQCCESGLLCSVGCGENGWREGQVVATLPGGELAATFRVEDTVTVGSPPAQRGRASRGANGRSAVEPVEHERVRRACHRIEAWRSRWVALEEVGRHE